MPAEFCRDVVAIKEYKCSRRGLQRSVLLCLAIVLTWLGGPGAPNVQAQDDALQWIGIQPLSGQIPVQDGSVNVANGNLHLEIPIVSLPERGKRPLEFKFIYDSNVWYQQPSNVWGYRDYGIYGIPGVAAGWNLISNVSAGGVGSLITPHNICHVDGMEDYDVYTDLSWTSSDGVMRTFDSLTYTVGYLNSCGNYTNMTTASADAVADDGSGYHMTITNGEVSGVYANDGYLGSGGEDPNGNFFNGYVDTLGRQSISITTNGMTNTMAVLTAGKNSGTASYIVTYEAVNYSTAFGVGGYEASGSFDVVKSIQLPDGTSYSFAYDSGTTSGHYGDLLSMTLPTGSTINFTYSNFNDSEAAPGGWTKHATRMLKTMTTPDGSWTFTPSVISQCSSTVLTCEQQLQVSKPTYDGRNDNAIYKSLIVTKYIGTSPVITFVSTYPVEADYYNGSISSSNLLATITQSFDFSQTCAGSPWNLSHGCVNVSPLSKTITLPIPSGTINQTTQYCYDIVYGNLLKKWEWNFYTGAVIHDPNPPTSCSVYSGVPTPNRTTTYAYQGGSNYLSSTRNLANLPTSITVTSSSGGTVAQTLFTYDGATLVTSGATGIKNHDDTNFGSGLTYRGNVTQVQKLVMSNYLTKSMTYDITGQLRTATDWTNLSANTTKYSYSDSFFTDAGDTNPPNGYTPAAPTNAYLTQITYPTVNSVTLNEYLGYYWGTGQKALSKDSNGQTSYSHYYDLMNRPTSTILPSTTAGTGWTYKVYPSGSETQVDTGVGITSSTLSVTCTGTSGGCRHDQTKTDTSGRTQYQILISDPEGADTVYTTYDSNGRVNSVSNPYRSTSSPTDGTETYGYDGLDRRTTITHADSNVAYTYYGSNTGSNGGLSGQKCSGYGVGYPVLSKDEAGNLREAWTDGFGRLIEIDEPNTSGSLSSGSATCYAYDLNNNLIGVLQPGSEATCSVNGGTYNRCFTYDSLSRLTSATNPETAISTGSGENTIYYYYTTTTSGSTPCSGEPSNVCLRVAPLENQGGSSTVTTTYSYDALNRMLSKTYSDGTPGAYYAYDNPGWTGWTVSNPYGRLSSVGTYNGSYWLTSTWYSYDQVGNVIETEQGLPGIDEIMSYAYNLDSSISSVTYPSARKVTYTTSNAQRMVAASDSANTYAKGPSSSSTCPYSLTGMSWACYTPPGELDELINGSSLTTTSFYNNRLQPCRFAVNSTTGAPSTCNDNTHSGDKLDLQYSFDLSSLGTSLCSLHYASYANNGNVASITDKVAGMAGRSQEFCYDGLNRVNSAQTTSIYSTGPAYCWAEAYTIDPIANLTAITQVTSNSNGSYVGCSEESGFSTTVNSHNQLAVSCYDAAGNNVGASGGSCTNLPTTYWHDGENRMCAYGGTSCATGTDYTYDVDGNRVEKSSGTIYWYGLHGEVLSETTLTGGYLNEYIYFGGQQIARVDSSGHVFYYFADYLGTSRLIVQDGTPPTTCYDADFYPFGVERSPYTNTCPQNYKFTGKERDSESGLDNFEARYNSSQYGRFTSPDQSGGNIFNPQSLNRYTYVVNNPLRYVDPLGLWHCDGNNAETADGCTSQGGTWIADKGDLPKVDAGEESAMPPPDTPLLGRSDSGQAVNTNASSTTADSGDVPVGLDIWHASPQCPTCGHIFTNAAGFVNKTTTIYAGIYGGLAGGSTLPGLAARGVGYLYGAGSGSGVVLGLYDNSGLPNYVDVAKQIGANALDVNQRLWNILDTFGESWTATQQFLDTSVAKGQQIMLNNSPSGLKPTGGFSMELQYLRSIGINVMSLPRLQVPQ